mmetsp:Transcript_27183/g.50749  ORF Transcript_27183/g.50749 Transcript_27183/m.50749 type:complete len:150 (-) Transcript_27183:689-1138(-)
MSAPESKLSAEAISEFKEAFSLFDKNGDGAITPEELGTVLKQLGETCTSEDLQGMIHEVDRKKSGDIDFSDFLHMMGEQNASVDDEVKIAFRLFDKDADGFISAAELKNVMTSLGEKIGDGEIKAIIQEHDADKDGKISLAEFVGMFKG